MSKKGSKKDWYHEYISSSSSFWDSDDEDTRSGHSDMSRGNQVVFYHYTSKEGKDAILDSGVIRPSKRRGHRDDAVFGDGVYGTLMDPENFSKTQLARNNYDSHTGVWRNLLKVGKVDFAFKLFLPKNRVEEVEETDRNIMIHHGNIYLDNVSYEVIPVPSRGRGMYHATGGR